MKTIPVTYLILALLFKVLLIKGQNDVLVGAIRWDAWVGGGHPVGAAVESALSPQKYHYRVPFFGNITSPSSVKINGTSQEIIDNEIYFANYAGLDYFAFVWYHDTCRLSTCRHNYLNSSVNSMINYCLIVESQRFLTEMSYSDIIGHFKNPRYQKVEGERPLFYFFGTTGINSNTISTLRGMCTILGAGNPYIVLICTGEYVGNKSYGFDAISMYGVSWLNDGVPYQEIVNTEISQWNYFASIELPIVPHVTTGWDKRPRYDNPVFWEPPASPSNWVQSATPEEISNHINNAILWVNENPYYCPSKTVLVYAWNEFDEGGWLCPTLPQFEGTARIESLHNSLNNSAGVSGINSEKEKLTLFPNPASNSITVNGINDNWYIMDMLGKNKISGEQNNIDVSSLENGMYILASGSEKIYFVVE